MRRGSSEFKEEPNKKYRGWEAHKWGAKLKKLTALVTGIGLIACAQISKDAAAQSVAEFYRGKVFNIYVGTSEGGAIDVYPRIISDYFSKHLPGNPTTVVRNMPGASGIKATTYIYGVAPQDGTVMGAATRGIVYGPLFGMAGATFDPKKVNWIGSPARETSVISVWATSTEVKTIADVMTKEVIVGATAGAVGNMDIFPEMLNNLVGTKFKVIRGYKGAPQVTLAMESGEVQGRGAWSWGSLKSSHMDWVKDGKIHILVQFGLKKASDLPDVPLALDLVKTTEDRRLLELICAPISIGYPAFMGPDVPKDRLLAVRQAYQEALKDPGLLALAERRQLEIDPVTSEEMEEIIALMYSTPRPIVERAQEILEPNAR